ncbi:fumarylacetoacetate hydrolase family protein [Algicella marina]|uniref:Fumarylacetoacetase-like C-terminal domain-containing protein n=1 Tax=Algicella marina TaxID=2683284 RepID=A0A6P1T0U6_9RHOB|nr:fumarylacetoacetate hydrolase family protein [Algicella marina]QHQ35066.1 hypothetical protein GO499_07585 [Algicella marina]
MPELADALAQEISARAPFREISAAVPDIATAAALQDRVTDILAAARGGCAGYKIAWNTAAQQRAFGLPHAGFGRVFRDDLRANGACLPADAFSHLAIEPEYIARMGSDLGAGASIDAAAAAIESVHIGFELMERRAVAAGADPHSIIATNVFNAGLVLGDTAITPTDLMEIPRHSRMTLNGTRLLDETDAAPEPPAAAVAFLANHFGSRGRGLKAGDLVLCGAHLAPLPVEPGSSLEFTVTGFEPVTMRFG